MNEPWKPNTGEMPDAELVEVMFSDGSGIGLPPAYPSEWDWGLEVGYPIVAYRVVKPKKEPKFKVGDLVSHYTSLKTGKDVFGFVTKVEGSDVTANWVWDSALDKFPYELTYPEDALKKVKIVEDV